MAKIMLMGMLIMSISFWMYTIGVALLRLQCIIAEREREIIWMNEAQRSE
jgi:heme exporter protein C